MVIFAYINFICSNTPQITISFSFPERQILSPVANGIKEVTSMMNNFYEEVYSLLKTSNERDSVAFLETELKVFNVLLMLQNPEQYKQDFKNLAKNFKCSRDALPEVIMDNYGLDSNEVALLQEYNANIYSKLYSNFRLDLFEYYPESINLSHKHFYISTLATQAFENYEDFNLEHDFIIEN